MKQGFTLRHLGAVLVLAAGPAWAAEGIPVGHIADLTGATSSVGKPLSLIHI